MQRQSMDGVLVIDKPQGPTSHDVVARVRRLLRERRVGHTGTLDPLATGVLPLVVGRATRMARFLSAGDKTYEAVIRLGFATDTGDAAGKRIGGNDPFVTPPRAAIESALDAFRGTFLQRPPAFSAKKIAGVRSYRLARAATSVPPAPDLRPGTAPPPSPRALTSVPAGADLRPGGAAPPSPDRVTSVPDPADLRPAAVPVTVHRLDVLGADGDTVTLSLDCSAGFYVRALAHDLGERLGVGAHLATLRRTHSGDYGLDAAVPLETAERDPASAAARLIPLSAMLPRLPAARLSVEGVRRARHGRDVGVDGDTLMASVSDYVRLLDPNGDLVGIAEPAARPGLLHPFVVLV